MPKPSRLKAMLPAVERLAIVVLLLVLGVGLWNLERGGAPPRRQPAQSAALSASAPPPPVHSPPAPAPLAQPAVYGPAADNGSMATYTIGKDRFTVAVTATDAACWIDVRPTPGGASLFQGTLQPCESHPIDATGALWLRVGNLGHVAVTADGVPVTLPSKPSLPYNLLLQK